MNTERLTAKELINKHFYFGVTVEELSKHIEDWNAQEVDHKTKQLNEEVQRLKDCITLTETSRKFNKDKAKQMQEEMDILKLALRRMLSYLDKGKAPYPGSFVYEDTKKVLNKLNR